MRARRSVPGTLTMAVAAALGLLGPAAAPAAGATAGGAGASGQWLRSNTGRTHSPQVLRELARASGTVINGPRAAATSGPVTGAPQGVDVASFQHPKSAQYPNGAPIDWARVYADGIRFAAVKVTEGAYYTNSWALTDLPQARSAGLTTVAYAFAIPNGGTSKSGTKYSGSPVIQADDLVSYLTSHGLTVPTVMLDIEYDPYAGSDGTPAGSWCYGLSQSAMVSWIASFGNEIKARTGRLPVIYTPPSWWAKCTGGSTAFGQTPVWVPDYSSTGSPGSLPAGWSNWNLWQYSATGTVPGIQASGSTDLDQLNPAILTLLNAGDRASVAGSPIVQTQVTPFTVSPAPAPTFGAAGLPAGLNVDSATGQITGWPDRPGSYHATVTAGDGSGVTGTVPFSWRVSAAPTAGPSGPVRLALGGKCLNDVGNSSANGTAMDIWACNGSSSQHWTVVKDQTLRIHGKCLDVYHGGTTAGTKVDLFSCNGSVAQQWRVQTRGQLVNPHSGKCLAYPGGSTANGTRVKIETCVGKNYQKWRPPAGPVVLELPGKCLSDPGNRTANGTAIVISGCNGGGSAQAWTLMPDGTVRIHGKCLDVFHGGTTAGTRVDLYSCNGSTAQRWWVNPAGAGVTLVSPVPGLALAVAGTSTANGTPVVLGTPDGTPRQTWRVQ
jgi:GH25 family lysozyme M1 (1,4-beta-N-acetylmuramidase)